MLRKIHFLLKYSFIAFCSSHHGNPEGPAKTTWGICSKMRSYTSVTTVQMILQTGHQHNKPPLQPTEESHERVSREFKNVKQKRSHLFNSWILTRVGPFNRIMILSTLKNGWKRKKHFMESNIWIHLNVEEFETSIAYKNLQNIPNVCMYVKQYPFKTTTAKNHSR